MDGENLGRPPREQVGIYLLERAAGGGGGGRRGGHLRQAGVKFLAGEASPVFIGFFVHDEQGWHDPDSISFGKIRGEVRGGVRYNGEHKGIVNDV